MDSWGLVWSVVFGAIGAGYFVFGRKQQRPIPLIAGLLLICLPYAIGNPWVLVPVCATVMLAVYYL